MRKKWTSWDGPCDGIIEYDHFNAQLCPDYFISFHSIYTSENRASDVWSYLTTKLFLGQTPVLFTNIGT